MEGGSIQSLLNNINKEQKDECKTGRDGLKKESCRRWLDSKKFIKLKTTYATAFVGFAARATSDTHWSSGIYRVRLRAAH